MNKSVLSLLSSLLIVFQSVSAFAGMDAKTMQNAKDLQARAAEFNGSKTWVEVLRGYRGYLTQADEKFLLDSVKDQETAKAAFKKIAGGIRLSAANGKMDIVATATPGKLMINGKPWSYDALKSSESQIKEIQALMSRTANLESALSGKFALLNLSLPQAQAIAPVIWVVGAIVAYLVGFGAHHEYCDKHWFKYDYDHNAYCNMTSAIWPVSLLVRGGMNIVDAAGAETFLPTHLTCPQQNNGIMRYEARDPQSGHVQTIEFATKANPATIRILNSADAQASGNVAATIFLDSKGQVASSQIRDPNMNRDDFTKHQAAFTAQIQFFNDKICADEKNVARVNEVLAHARQNSPPAKGGADVAPADSSK